MKLKRNLFYYFASFVFLFCIFFAMVCVFQRIGTGQEYPYAIKTLMPNYREFDDTRHFYSLQQLALEQGKKPADLIAPVCINVQEQEYNGNRYQ